MSQQKEKCQRNCDLRWPTSARPGSPVQLPGKRNRKLLHPSAWRHHDPPTLCFEIGAGFNFLIGLSYYRSVLLIMSVASMLKQNLNLLFLTQEETTVPFAVMIGGYNTLFNSLNDLLFLCAQTS